VCRYLTCDAISGTAATQTQNTVTSAVAPIDDRVTDIERVVTVDAGDTTILL